jgi:hypothetical protein
MKSQSVIVERFGGEFQEPALRRGRYPELPIGQFTTGKAGALQQRRESNTPLVQLGNQVA